MGPHSFECTWTRSDQGLRLNRHHALHRVVVAHSGWREPKKNSKVAQVFPSRVVLGGGASVGESREKVQVNPLVDKLRFNVAALAESEGADRLGGISLGGAGFWRGVHCPASAVSRSDIHPSWRLSSQLALCRYATGLLYTIFTGTPSICVT